MVDILHRTCNRLSLVAVGLTVVHVAQPRVRSWAISWSEYSLLNVLNFEQVVMFCDLTWEVAIPAAFQVIDSHMCSPSYGQHSWRFDCVPRLWNGPYLSAMIILDRARSTLLLGNHGRFILIKTHVDSVHQNNYVIFRTLLIIVSSVAAQYLPFFRFHQPVSS